MMNPEELQRLKKDVEMQLELLWSQREWVEARILANVFLLVSVNEMLRNEYAIQYPIGQ